MFESFLKPPITFPTLTGSIVTFNSQYAGLPLKSHTVALTATQSGSGTPSPDNVRTINGYSAINISHSDADTSNPAVYTIQIGSTVYGGYYDARTGLLTVTHEIIDLGSINYTYRTDTTKPIFQGINAIYAKRRGSAYDIGNDKCSIYKTVSSNDVSQDGYDYSFAISITGRNIYIQDSRYTVASDFKTAMNGVQLVYELATPTTIQLPPCPIDILEGVNNIWADTGDTTLQYIKLG